MAVFLLNRFKIHIFFLIRVLPLSLLSSQVSITGTVVAARTTVCLLVALIDAVVRDDGVLAAAHPDIHLGSHFAVDEHPIDFCQAVLVAFVVCFRSACIQHMGIISSDLFSVTKCHVFVAGGLLDVLHRFSFLDDAAIRRLAVDEQAVFRIDDFFLQRLDEDVDAFLEFLDRA